MLDIKKNMLTNAIVQLINKLFEGVFYIVEKSEDKEQLKKSLENFKHELLNNYSK